jgi:hypothetical protein
MVTPRPVTEIIERLKPPHHLIDEQVEVWSAIAASHPADWFDQGSAPLLAQLCRHVVMSNRLAELIERNAGHEDWLALLREQRQETEAIRKLATSLRITPQSLINHNGNKKQITAVNRPWAFGDKG